jgi:hypothetical protein
MRGFFMASDFAYLMGVTTGCVDALGLGAFKSTD